MEIGILDYPLMSDISIGLREEMTYCEHAKFRDTQICLWILAPESSFSFGDQVKLF